MAQRLQFRPELDDVADLAVVGHPDRAVLVRHGLLGGRGKVDDRETAMAERGGPADLHVLTVWTAVRERPDHPQRVVRPRHSAITVDVSGNAAHYSYRSRRSWE